MVNLHELTTKQLYMKLNLQMWSWPCGANVKLRFWDLSFNDSLVLLSLPAWLPQLAPHSKCPPSCFPPAGGLLHFLGHWKHGLEGGHQRREHHSKPRFTVSIWKADPRNKKVQEGHQLEKLWRETSPNTREMENKKTYKWPNATDTGLKRRD